MKQNNKKSKNKIITESKPRYTRIGFWFPLLYGAVNVFLLVCSLMIYSVGGNVAHPEIAQIILRVFQVCLIFSPTAFIVMLFLRKKHREKFPTCPDYFKKLPGFFSIFTILLEVMYLITLMV